MKSAEGMTKLIQPGLMAVATLVVMVAFACRSRESSEPPPSPNATSASSGNAGAASSTTADVPRPSEDKSKMMQGKPLFDVRLDIENCPHDVYVNGGLVERNLEETPSHIEYPVNHYLRSGRNELEVHMIKQEDEPYECDVKVALRYKDESAPPDAEPITLLTLVHDAKTALANDLAQGSSPSGAYDSRTGLPRVGGDLQVGVATVASLPADAQVLSRSFDVGLPFPEWAFLRGEKMTLDWKFTRRSELNRAHDTLLARYTELHALLAKHDVDGFLDACEERSRELDIAYYKSPGETRRGLERQLRAAMTDQDLELADLSKDPGARWGYFVGSTGTLAMLTQGTRASPIFRFQAKDDTPFSLVFPVMFRKDGTRFIVTR